MLRELHARDSYWTSKTVPSLPPSSLRAYGARREMVQTFMVVRCFQCETFQVELVSVSAWLCVRCLWKITS